MQVRARRSDSLLAVPAEAFGAPAPGEAGAFAAGRSGGGEPERLRTYRRLRRPPAVSRGRRPQYAGAARPAALRRMLRQHGQSADPPQSVLTEDPGWGRSTDLSQRPNPSVHHSSNVCLGERGVRFQLYLETGIVRTRREIRS